MILKDLLPFLKSRQILTSNNCANSKLNRCFGSFNVILSVVCWCFRAQPCANLYSFIRFSALISSQEKRVGIFVPSCLPIYPHANITSYLHLILVSSFSKCNTIIISIGSYKCSISLVFLFGDTNAVLCLMYQVIQYLQIFLIFVFLCTHIFC